MVEIVKGTAQAAVEDGTAANGECAVLADRPSAGEESSGLCWVVELELLVGNDLASTTFLVGELAILEGDDWCACASLPLTLQWQLVYAFE